MFTSPVTGDDSSDANLINRAQLNSALLNYATNTGLVATQTTASLAAAAAQGNTTLIESLDQRVTAEMAAKLTQASLSPYALQSDITRLGDEVTANASALQVLQASIGASQTGLSSGLGFKADQSDLEATNLLMASKISQEQLGVALLPLATSTQLSQSIALAQATAQTLAAASYGTRQEVTQLTIDVAGKSSQSDLINALSNYQSAPQTAAAISSAVTALEGQVTSALSTQATALAGKADGSLVTSLQSTVNLHSLQLDAKLSSADLALATQGFATTAAVSSAITAALVAAIPTGFATSAQVDLKASTASVLQLQSDLGNKLSQSDLPLFLASYATNSALASPR